MFGKLQHRVQYIKRLKNVATALFRVQENSSPHPKAESQTSCNTKLSATEKSERGRLIECGLFNASWYLSTYPDVASVGHEPLDHYLRYGWKESRNPSSVFHNDWYLEENADVKDGAMCPLIHYMEFGTQENRRPNALFCAAWYVERYPEVAQADCHPLAHYERYGTEAGYDPHPYFNTAWVAKQPCMQKSKHPNALAAYFAGDLADIDVYPQFDSAWYRKSVAGVARSSPHVACDYDNRPSWQHAEKNPEERSANVANRKRNLGVAPAARHSNGITIGIVGYNSDPTVLRRCVRSTTLALQRAGIINSSQICFIENGDSSRTEGLDPSIRVASPRGNVGFGAGHNHLMAEMFESSDTGYYLALNPDAVLSPDSLSALLNMTAVHRDNALIEATQFPDEHPKVYDMVSFETPWVSGACVLIPRRVYDVIGGFDPGFFMYCEDVDLSWRARAAGFKTLTCPRALVYHATRHRPFSIREHKQFLHSGFRLARKWGSDTFMSTLKAEFDLHYALEAKEWNGVALPTTTHASGFADFDHLFYFAETRW